MINSIRPATASPARNRQNGENGHTMTRGHADRLEEHDGNPPRYTLFNSRLNRTNSDDVLQGLLTDMQPSGTQHTPHLRSGSKESEWMRVQEMRVPKHQKEIIKDMVLHERYVGE